MRLALFRFILLVGVLIKVLPTYAQNLFDYTHSQAYADYLFKSGRYEESAAEYDRIIFMQPADTTAWLRLVRSYQYLNQHEMSLQYANRAESALKAYLPTLGRMKIYSLLHNDSFSRVREVIPTYDLPTEDQIFLETMSFSLNREWGQAIQVAGVTEPNYLVQQAYKINLEALQQPRKHPLLAGAMSGIVPGSGKFYTGRWKDGLFSLLLFASSGWQAYRIISQKGLQNPGAWFFGGMTVGFYSGNVYGAVKSAKEYNENEQEKYEKRSLELLDIYYGK